MNETYFFDVYALIEILRQNPIYRPFASAKFITTKLNIFEVYRKLLADYGAETAEPFLDNYYQYAKPLDQNTLREAARLKQKNRRFTLTDCFGLAMSRRFNVPFLTGDSAFQGMEGVEYVK